MILCMPEIVPNVGNMKVEKTLSPPAFKKAIVSAWLETVISVKMTRQLYIYTVVGDNEVYF